MSALMLSTELSCQNETEIRFNSNPFRSYFMHWANMQKERDCKNNTTKAQVVYMHVS